MTQFLSELPSIITIILVISGIVWAYLPVHLQRQLNTFRNIVREVVQATEQAHSDLSGPQKKEKAIAALNVLIKGSHIPVNPILIDTLIESAVLLLPHISPLPVSATLSTQVNSNSVKPIAVTNIGQDVATNISN